MKHTDTLEATVASSKYEKLGIELGRMLEGKQAAYGDSFSKAGKMMAILYPEGIPLLKLGDALTIVRVLDKLFRIATDKDAFGESPWKDIAGYAMLSVVRAEEGKAAIPASFETRIPASFDHSSVCGISHPIFHQHCELPLGHSKSGLNIEHRSGLGTCWST